MSQEMHTGIAFDSQEYTIFDAGRQGAGVSACKEIEYLDGDFQRE